MLTAKFPTIGLFSYQIDADLHRLRIAEPYGWGMTKL